MCVWTVCVCRWTGEGLLVFLDVAYIYHVNLKTAGGWSYRYSFMLMIVGTGDARKFFVWMDNNVLSYLILLYSSLQWCVLVDNPKACNGPTVSQKTRGAWPCDVVTRDVVVKTCSDLPGCNSRLLFRNFYCTIVWLVWGFSHWWSHDDYEVSQ